MIGETQYSTDLIPNRSNFSAQRLIYNNENGRGSYNFRFLTIDNQKQIQLLVDGDIVKTIEGEELEDLSSDATNNVTEDIATNNSDIVLAVGYFVNRTENKLLGQILTSNDGKICTRNI